MKMKKTLIAILALVTPGCIIADGTQSNRPATRTQVEVGVGFGYNYYDPWCNYGWPNHYHQYNHSYSSPAHTPIAPTPIPAPSTIPHTYSRTYGMGR